MAKECMVTGRKTQTGNNVSHSHRKTRRTVKPNLQSKRFWVPSLGRWVRLRLSTAAIREIDKRGIDTVVQEMRARGVRV